MIRPLTLRRNCTGYPPIERLQAVLKDTHLEHRNAPPAAVGRSGTAGRVRALRQEVERTLYARVVQSAGQPFTTTNGRNAEGELCYGLGEHVLDTLLAAPDISEDALVGCRDHEVFKGNMLRGEIYDAEIRIATIDRGLVTVSSIEFPTGSWIYTLATEQQ